MDLRLPSAEPTDAEREAIDTVVGTAATDDGRVSRADRTRRHLLLPALRASQRRVGWVSEGALGYASRRLDVPPADAYGVASFYALISLEERPEDVLHVCTDLACQLAGAEVPPGAQPSPCLGLCERAPAALRTIAGPEPREVPLPEAAAAAAAARRARPPPAAPHRRRRRSGVARRLPGARRLRGAPPRVRARRDGRDPRGERLAAARPRRRCLPHRPEVGGGRAAARAAALPRLQRRRVGAGHVQGPHPDGGRSVRARRVDDDRRLCHRLRARVRLRSRRIPGRTRTARERIRTRALARPARRRRDGHGLLLRHRAAHRRRCVRVRRGDGALPVDRGLPRRAAQQAAVPGRGRPLRQAHRREQRRDALQRARRRVRHRQGVRRDRHPRLDRHAPLLRLRPCRDAGPVRGARSARTFATCSSARARGRRRPCCSAAPRARSCDPTSSTCR